MITLMCRISITDTGIHSGPDLIWKTGSEGCGGLRSGRMGWQVSARLRYLPQGAVQPENGMVDRQQHHVLHYRTQPVTGASWSGEKKHGQRACVKP
jgi:hypothetical protein